MASLYVSSLGKRICWSRSPAEIYDILRGARYLSRSAIREQTSVIALIEHTIEEFQRKAHMILGDEIWRHIESELVAHKYLSFWGRLARWRYVSRDPPPSVVEKQRR